MPAFEWYPVYDTTTKDVVGVGGFDPSFDPGEGFALGDVQTDEMPFGVDLEYPKGTYHYTYNTETNLVEAKA